MYRTMEIRRIQITGGSSYMVTLPKSWAESRGLKKNDPVMVVPQPDGSLLLTLSGEESSKASVRTLNVDDFDIPDALYRCLIGAYIAGHDQIVLKSESAIKGPYLEAISQFTQTSMGMEIVEEEEDRILIKDLINHSEVVPQKNVKREYILVKRMIGDALSSTPPTLDEMDLRDTEVDRIHWLVQRQASIYQQDIGLSSRTGLRLATVMSCMGVSKILERMGDHAVLIVDNLPSMNDDDRKKFRKNADRFGEKLLKHFEVAMESWLNADNVLAEKVIRSKEELSSATDRCFEDVSDKDAANMIRGSIARIVDYCSDIAESAINISMENRPVVP